MEGHERQGGVGQGGTAGTTTHPIPSIHLHILLCPDRFQDLCVLERDAPQPSVLSVSACLHSRSFLSPSVPRR